MISKERVYNAIKKTVYDMLNTFFLISLILIILFFWIILSNGGG